MMINPVLRRELRTKLRSWKAFMVITLYLLTLVGVGGLFIWATQINIYRQGFDPQNGVSMYMILAGFQLGLIGLITPALTAGAISGERERQTLDLLILTKMSPFSIVIGKLMASLSHIVLLILASIPIFSIVFFYGGISLGNVLTIFCFFLVTALMLGSLGIFCSTFFRRTTVSTVVCYIFILCISLGSLFALAIFQNYSYAIQQQALTYGQSLWIVGMNPFVGFLSVLSDQVGNDVLTYLLSSHNNPGKITIQPWKVNVIFNLVLSVVLILLSTWKIRPVKGRVSQKSKGRKKNDVSKGPQIHEVEPPVEE